MNASTLDRPSAMRRPWYRELWPWLLMAGPALVVVGGIYAMWLAASTDDALVADDYYKRGLSINQKLELADNAARMQITARVSIGADGRVRVLVSSAAALPASIKLVLAHATRAGEDQTAILERTEEGTFVGRLAAPPVGRWLLSIEGDNWRLPAVEVSQSIADVRLGAASR